MIERELLTLRTQLQMKGTSKQVTMSNIQPYNLPPLPNGLRPGDMLVTPNMAEPQYNQHTA